MSLPTSSTPGYGLFRGHVACDCLIAWIPAYERMLRHEGILGPLQRISIFQLTGGNPSSGGTHTRGGTGDIVDLPGERDLVIMRQMGADAGWLRPFNWDGNGGIKHVHFVLRGCPHNSPSRYQIDAVDAGFNGLGSGGRGGSDTGPRPLSKRTWREGVEWAQQQEDDMADAATQATLADILNKVTRIDGEVTALRGAEADRAQASRERQNEIIAALEALAVEVGDDATKTQVNKVKALVKELGA
jgi:hypothetical protein